jgi:hypothetical protein
VQNNGRKTKLEYTGLDSDHVPSDYRDMFDLFFRYLLYGTSTVTVHRPGKRVFMYSRTSPR